MPATEVGDRLIDEIELAFIEESELPHVIDASERDDANLWLRRTQWAVYLRGIDPQHLIDCVRAPDGDSSDPTEIAASAIWDAMAAPLQAYMDADNIERHTIPWQQILMFFTLLGRGEAGWRTAESYPPILSKLIKIARFMVVYKALKLDSTAEAMLYQLAEYQMAGDWDTENLRTYGLKIHYNSTTTGHIGWMNQDQLLYQQFNFTIGDFRGFIHGLTSSARQILYNELLFTVENGSVPAIPWQAIYDDPTETAHGWNFLKDTRTPWPVDGEQWLIGRRFIESSAGRLRMVAIDAYLQRVAYFREKLAIAIHVSGGQPARAPELLSIRHCNTDSGGRRNVFIEDGLVTFVSQYHKGFYASNDTKVIHRYLPREVGELVVHYLWLVLPFTRRLEAYVAKVRRLDGVEEIKSKMRQAYLWGPDPGTSRDWSSKRLREVLKRETTIGLNGQAINLNAYQDIAIGISRRFIRPSSVFPNNTQQDAAYLSHVAGMIYGRGITEQPGFVSTDNGGAESALGLAQFSP
ncbi:hypothetical protein PENARI_c072G04807 [Penicillium arizonense]|uniref:Uncharacterized protein n=1 Tax=Penicillium arizonense TaxID=1835702 RepID=A0A1F5L1W6_PENAI|nr:hypothetical protein PENARI_c072G04807 [Penicillium arizonense]OGE47046.1 hypothetical protein PENARI_c072G04807 [Penicillium arizonense]